MTRTRAMIYAKELTGVQAGRADSSQPWRLFAAFRNVYGTADALGREATAVISCAELADLLGAIPYGDMNSEDIAAVARVRTLLRELEVAGACVDPDPLPGRGGSPG